MNKKFINYQSNNIPYSIYYNIKLVKDILILGQVNTTTGPIFKNIFNKLEVDMILVHFKKLENDFTKI